MRIREALGWGRCEACGDENGQEIHVVTFERPEMTVLMCKTCLDWSRTLLEILDIKEAEA